MGDGFKADKNHALVRRTVQAVWKQRLHQLRKVYLATPLSRITQIVLGPQKNDDDALQLLQEMVAAKEITIKIEARQEGRIVRFLESVDLQVTAEAIRAKVE